MTKENDQFLLERGANPGYTVSGAKKRDGNAPVNLENGISAKPSVQVTREIRASNGCKITLVFRKESEYSIRREIASLLIAAFEDRRRCDDEASALPVQSIH